MQTNIENTAMEILKQIQAIPENQDPSERLEKFMHILAAGFNADAAVCYVTVDDNYLEFLCGSGLVEKQYKHHIRYGEGFIGEIAATRQTLSYSENNEPPAVKNERIFKSALGAPLLRWSRTYGTIVIAHKKPHAYSQTDNEALETIAMFLTAALSSEEMIAYKKKLVKSRGLKLKDHLKGMVLNKGYGIGNAVVHRRRQAVTEIFAEDVNKELARLDDAKEKMNKSLDEKFNATQLGIGEHTDILETYRMFARDKGWYRKISDNISGGLTAEAAVERAYEDMWNRLSGLSRIHI